MQSADQLLLKVGGASYVPPSGHKLLCVDSDGAAKLIDSAGAKTSLLGGWQQVERKVIAADVQSYDFSNLNGDVDEAYYISAELIGGAGSAGGILTLRPNTLSTNAEASGQGADDGGTPFGDNRAEMTIGYVPTATHRAIAYGTIFAKTGSERLMASQCTLFLAGVASVRTSQFGSQWSDTSTNITSLRVFSSVATGIGIGSVLTLYKRAF